MTSINKRLLIFESRGNSNRCIPCRGKPDQHDTYASHVSPRTPSVRFLRVVPVRGNLLRDNDRFGQIPPLLRKRAPDIINNTSADRSVGPYPTSLSSQLMKQGGGHKPSSCRRPITRFTRPISPVCDWYIQYLLTGPTHQSLTDTGGDNNHGGVGLPHTHSPTFPTSCPHFPLVAPPDLHFNQVPLIKPKC
jgi:hypothetical protein